MRDLADQFGWTVRAIASVGVAICVLNVMACKARPQVTQTPAPTATATPIESPPPTSATSVPTEASETPAPLPATAPATQPQNIASSVRTIAPFEGVVVYPQTHEVHIEALSCLEEGFLEQVACSPHTREHESLVVTKVKPSHVHAALLMAGLEPGSPGKWVYEVDSYSVVPPKGDSVNLFLKYANAAGQMIEEPVQTWMREQSKSGPKPFPPGVWIFGGSRFENNPEFMGPGEHYVADMTGSIVGLVTFGDEVVGFSRVMPDLEEVAEPVWEVDTDHVPKEDTPVTLILRKANALP